ncbi:MAG: RHS repeat-associated core domain-containing protein [Ignavibacteriaceae bacterium]|nr:RHS repeat-associated core domain-containing protein [Ignavibacteriaceae bacterium]
MSEQRYLPFGEIRTDVGTIAQTDFGFTGQRDLGSDLGLMDYKARFYSAYITQFSQPDTIVPDLYNPQSLNRYSYVLNQPVNFSDPSGHMRIQDGDQNDRLRPWLVDKYKPKPEPPKPPRPPKDDDILSSHQDDTANGFNGFPNEIGYRIPSIPITSFPIDIWLWRWTANLDFNLTHQTSSTKTIISAAGFIVGDGEIGINSVTYWLPHVSAQTGPYSIDALWGVKASWDSAKLSGRTTVSYTQGNDTLNTRTTMEFEYRPKNAAIVAAVPIAIYGGYTVFGGIYGALQTLVGVGTAACQSGFCQ